MWTQLLVALMCTLEISGAWRSQRMKRRIRIERVGDFLKIHHNPPWSKSYLPGDEAMKGSLAIQHHSISYPHGLKAQDYIAGFHPQGLGKSYDTKHSTNLQVSLYNREYPQLEPMVHTSGIHRPASDAYYMQIPDYHRESIYRKEPVSEKIQSYNSDQSKTPINIVYDNYPIILSESEKPKETGRYKNDQYGQYPKPTSEEYPTESRTTEVSNIETTETTALATEISTETTISEETTMLPPSKPKKEKPAKSSEDKKEKPAKSSEDKKEKPAKSSEDKKEKPAKSSEDKKEKPAKSSEDKKKNPSEKKTSVTEKPTNANKKKGKHQNTEKIKEHPQHVRHLKDPDFEQDLNDTLTSSGEEISTAISDETTLFPTTEDPQNDDLIQESLKTEFVNSIDQKFRSLVFNPIARPEDKFQRCVTPRNESGQCRYVQHCLLPNIVGSLDQFMGYVCIIEERFIGVCCPDFPVDNLVVKWDGSSEDDQDELNKSPQQPEEGCGVSSNTRIIGGKKTEPKEWPWMAALISMRSGQFFCGGSLINSRYVLTAAHCTFSIPRNQILVRLGEYDFRNSSNTPGEDHPVVEIKRHAQYSRKTLRNDVALLKLSFPAQFGEFVSTICLPQPSNQYTGEIATVIGWGNIRGGGPTSNVLLAASLPVWSNAECTSAQGRTISKTSICAGSKTGEQGVCNGDSGGPLMLLDSNTKTWKVIGIVSWGRRGCSTRFPTVFTRVSEYLKWIEVHAT